MVHFSLLSMLWHISPSTTARQAFGHSFLPLRHTTSTEEDSAASQAALMAYSCLVSRDSNNVSDCPAGLSSLSLAMEHGPAREPDVRRIEDNDNEVSEAASDEK